MCLLNYAIYVFIIEPYSTKPFTFCLHVSALSLQLNMPTCCCVVITWQF